jgi:hypothetical protein
MFPKMTVRHTDGEEVEVAGKKADVIRFERKFKEPATAIFGGDGFYTEYLWFFGWLAEGRVREVPDFDEWMETVDGVDVGSFTENEDPPTDPGGSPTP